jgi:murein DD-endopeptidase MepM/ murein hydrolase activator NlpD
MENMFCRKYFLNPETLRFERVRLGGNRRVRFFLIIGLGLMALAVLLRFGFERFYPTPRQLIYENWNSQLRSEYVALNTNLLQVEAQLSELSDRDDRFYRSILSLEPVPSSIREAGTGGSEPYADLRNIRESGMVKNVSQRIDKISNRVQIQSSSLENVYQEAIHNLHFMACKPSINPISPGDPCWLTSTFGYRRDPFTGLLDPHHGIDLAGPYGLAIHASGDGKVAQAHLSKFGYGKEVVVDHGFGYISRYAHLDDIYVEPGQEVKRGEIIGTLGNTGRSTGPHLHYEVRKYGAPLNPFYFFYENLTPKEYDLLATRANHPSGPYLASVQVQD